jgi:two-component system, OmpR family, phosphate regulon sensor histidine kinase PhoR
MNKRLIIILGLVMALVLLSLITVQINWIRNAYVVKEQQFDQLVHQALSEIVNTISREEAYNLILDEFYPTNQKKGNSTGTNSKALFDSKLDLSAESPLQKAKNKSSHTDSILNKLQNNSQQTNDQGIEKQQIEERQRYINQLLNRMFSNTPNIKDRITSNEIEAIVNETLLDYGIDIAFEFAVREWNNNLTYQSDNFNPKENSSIYRVRLYPDDFNQQTNYLDLYFPNKRNFIFRSLAFIGISSGVLTLLIVFTFAFTLYVIFRQKRLSEIKNDFVNNMTHELKTPISTISLASQMLGDTTIPNESKNLVRISEIIRQESKRLGYQVEKVLQIAALDKGNFTLNLKKINMHELIENVISNFIIQVDSKGGLLIPSLHAEDPEIMADPVHMTNVISNLLDNAIKYTPSSPEIYIETRNIEQNIQVVVKDNGIGISKINQKKIFERFYRVSTGNIHDVKGFGLGLNYVKKIVEMHKGTIEVESELEKGTTFSFKIPIKNQNSHE